MTQVEVLVKSKETGNQRVMTYKSFLDVSEMFELIGQSDSEGNLIPGDPNLNPRHQRTQASEGVVVHAADPGVKFIGNVFVSPGVTLSEELIQAVEMSKDLKVVSMDVPREKRKYNKKQPA